MIHAPIQTDKIRSHLVVIIAMVLLSCCAGSGLWLASQKQKAEGWVRHTYEVKDQLSQVRISLLRTEVYRRSYVLGDQQAGRTLAEISRDIPRQLQALRYATADNPGQRLRTQAFGSFVTRRLAEVGDTILLADRGRRAEAALIMASNDSHRTTAEIIRLIDEIAAEERRLLTVRLEQAKNLDSPIRAGLIFSGLLIVLLGFLVQRERKQRMLALRVANEQLEDDIARREMAESELALLAANATDAVLRVDLDGCCIYASPSVEHLFGVKPNQLVGQPLGTSISSIDSDDIQAFHDSLVSGAVERGVQTYRASRIDAPAREIWIEAHSGLVRDVTTGEPREIISSLRDVTERKQLEADLEAARGIAEAAARAKSSFLANMSHEIRTPMNGVLGFADLLLNSDISAEQRQHAQLIVDSGKAMMRLLNDILDLSKIEAGQMQVSPEPIDLRHALRNCIKLVQPAASQKGLHLELQVDDSLPICILLDGLRLRQVTLNLLANAVKFTPSGGVCLRVRRVEDPSGSMFEVAVEDTGIGIPLHRQGAVFEQFTQAEHSTVKRFGGTGLGLAISKQLAVLMGGSLDLVSEEGVGTTFSLQLPLFKASRDEAASTSNSFTASKNRSLRVLLAEDHDVNQALMKAMLTRLGHDSIIVGDGSQALEAAVKAAEPGNVPFDLVLMDMQMPVMDGLEAAKQIRAAGITPSRLPILALTANAYADDVSACLDAGMQAHLAKPLELATLAAAIQKWTASPAGQVLAAPTFAVSPALQARFDARKAELIAFAERLAATDNVADGELQQLAELLHKLAGSAAMFGEKELGACASKLEEQLADVQPASRGETVSAVVSMLQKAA
jgi:PAS domain S-box-containing protein